jgi:hypothetical protein
LLERLALHVARAREELRQRRPILDGHDRSPR